MDNPAVMVTLLLIFFILGGISCSAITYGLMRDKVKKSIPQQVKAEGRYDMACDSLREIERIGKTVGGNSQLTINQFKLYVRGEMMDYEEGYDRGGTG